jgi:protein-S-isoprenylcysteine O-methyltransferase Ste14
VSGSSPATPSERGAAPSAVRVGRVLFQHRGWLPAPLVAVMLATGSPPVGALRWGLGAALIATGEGIRLAAVGHIGPASRTRDDSAHRVVDTGPYAHVRNPLYVGNLLLWAGVGVLLWPWALVAPALLAAHYGFIVRWEEANLAARLGAPYLDYCARVPRWIPRWAGGEKGRWDARMAFRSERSTLLVLAVVILAVLIRGVAAD